MRTERNCITDDSPASVSSGELGDRGVQEVAEEDGRRALDRIRLGPARAKNHVALLPSVFLSSRPAPTAKTGLPEFDHFLDQGFETFSAILHRQVVGDDLANFIFSASRYASARVNGQSEAKDPPLFFPFARYIAAKEIKRG